MADEIDVFAHSDWDRDYGSARGTRLGPRAGSVELGASLFELDPGAQATPYHLHHGNEELLLVLDGALELRTPSGTRTLRRGNVAGFVTGPDGAHRVRNVSGERARYVIVSTMRYPEVAEQLDTGTVLALTGPMKGWAFPAGSDESLMALTKTSIEADPGA